MSGDAHAAFTAAVELFVGVVRRIPADAWERPGLGEWTVRDLAGHTGRALSTVDSYLAAGADSVDLDDAGEYYARGASKVDPAAVAERGRQAGRDLGDDPAAALTALAERVVPAVLAASGDALVGTIAGGMRLRDYLPTRVFELTVHSLDLAAAVGVEVELPAAAASASLHVLADIAGLRPGAAGPLLLAATGRGPLPPGFTVL